MATPLAAAASAPSAEAVEQAFRRALERRIDAHRTNGRFAHYSPAALTEQVVGLPAPPERRGRWWSIGWIQDGLTGNDWRVWMDPESRRLRMVVRRPSRPQAPPPARRPDGRYYDGMRRRWLMPDGSLALDQDHESGSASPA